MDATENADLTPIFDAIISQIKPPAVSEEGTLQLLVSALRYDSFQGKYSVGRIERGKLKRGQQVTLCQESGMTKAR